MNLDIHDAVVMTIILAAVGAIISLWVGLRRLRQARRMAYYRIARKQMSGGWRTLFFAAALVGFAVLMGFYAEPVAYTYFPPSPTQSRTPTITLTPTISLTPTITETPTLTLTPAESYTPTITPTAFVPESILAQFTSSVTPDPEAVFSQITFSLSVKSFVAVDPQVVFEQPLTTIYATYTYNNMNDGVDWTALWYRNGELLNYETAPWEGGTGGYGQYDLSLPENEWLAGTYQLIFFVGSEWKVLGEFLVQGDPPTPTFTPSPSATLTPTLSPTITNTRRPTFTPRPTDTRWPTKVK
jgi:hypothetical protein